MSEEDRDSDSSSRWRHEGRPFDESDERREIRRMAREWQRYKWGMGFLAHTLAWAGAFIAFVWAGRDTIAKVLKAVFR